jgi:hypothetical protein
VPKAEIGLYERCGIFYNLNVIGCCFVEAYLRRGICKRAANVSVGGLERLGFAFRSEPSRDVCSTPKADILNADVYVR